MGVNRADHLLKMCGYERDDRLVMLSYKQTLNIEPDYAKYTYLVFDNESQSVEITTLDSNDAPCRTILTMAEITAIRAKCRELGWSNEL